MSIHVFGAIVTHHGTAANNRAETEGNITTLQKLLWFGRVHSSVSAEAIRFALRRRLAEAESRGTNRTWDEDIRVNTWADAAFASWAGKGGETFIDDDLLGFMSAEAAKDEAGDETEEANSAGSGKKPRAKGTTKVRRAVLEITRAISMTPFGGDVTFNAASPGATPSAAKKGASNPVPYGTELHATRYQYGFALTPERLRVPGRAATAVEALCALGEVAGNHGRFLYDFSPESAVFRVTHDPAPRLLYAFEESGRDVVAPSLLARVEAGDLPAAELVVAGAYCRTDEGERLKELGAMLEPGVRKAAKLVCDMIAAGGK